MRLPCCARRPPEIVFPRYSTPLFRTQTAAPPDDASHEGSPHDQGAHEPLGPLTPDDERPVGDTPEAHDEIVPEDLPKDHPGRQEAERMAAEDDGVVRGNT